MKVKKKIRYAGECCICHEPIEVGEEYVEAPLRKQTVSHRLHGDRAA